MYVFPEFANNIKNKSKFILSSTVEWLYYPSTQIGKTINNWWDYGLWTKHGGQFARNQSAAYW